MIGAEEDVGEIFRFLFKEIAVDSECNVVNQKVEVSPMDPVFGMA